MSFEKCGVCHEYGFEDHKCKPIFFFKHEDYGDEWEEIRGRDFEDAAEAFAERFNEGSGEYSMMHGDNTVEVLISDGTTEKKFVVSAEASIDYHAEESTPRPESKPECQGSHTWSVPCGKLNEFCLECGASKDMKIEFIPTPKPSGDSSRGCGK